MKELKEIEVKAKIESFEEIQSKLTDLGCVFSEPQIQKDRVYLDNSIEFPDKTVGTLYLRIRNSNGKNIFTLKKQLATEAENLEKELVINDPEKCNDILKLMGYHEVLQISKTRIKCKFNEMKICLDQVDRLGAFVEVEKMTTENDTEKVKKELFEFLEILGVKKEDQIFKGYATMIYELDNN
jgi:adenylate cyclase class 2